MALQRKKMWDDTLMVLASFPSWGLRVVFFTTLLALLLMWFGISVPLVFLGAYFGYRRPQLSYPTKTNLIPRSVPPRPWYMSPIFCVLVGGVLPFGAVFIELFFILSSIWLHQYYYVFGFLLIVFLILLVTCGEVARAASPRPPPRLLAPAPTLRGTRGFRSRLCCATFSCAPKTTTGGGGPSSQAPRRQFTCSCRRDGMRVYSLWERSLKVYSP